MADASGYSEPKHSDPGTRPSRITIETAWTEPVSTWTVAMVRAALDLHEAGDFSLSSVLADAATRDSTVAGDLEIRCRALASRSSLPFKVEAGEGDGRKREAARRRCERLWWHACPETTIYSVQKDAIMLGASVGRIWWSTSADEWRPRLHHLPPHGLSWSDVDGWVYQSRDGTRHLVTPGDGTWFLHLPNGSRSWMGGAIRRLGEIWLQRVYARRDWARFSERHGLPVLAVREAQAARDDIEQGQGSEGAAAKAFYGRLRASMTRDGVLKLPQSDSKDVPGWDAEWLELVGTSYEGFAAQLRDLKGEVHEALLGRDPNGSSKGGDGELANERRHTEFLATDAETLTTTIRECIWKPDAAYNVDVTDTEVAAWGRWDTRPPPDLERRATTLDKCADAVGKLVVLGVDCVPVLNEFGLLAPSGVQAPPRPTQAQPADQPEEAA